MRPRDPACRCTPVREWPALDRTLWAKALEPSDPFEPDVGYARRWAATTLLTIESGYGRWLGWLERSGQLDPSIPPGDRSSADRVRAYLQMLRDAGQADNSCATRLQQLGNALQAMHLDRDWSWLHRVSSRIHSTAVLVRDPVKRMQPADQVVALGRDLMRAAVHDRFRTPLERAVLYRDGLVIAFLIYRPLRLGNLAAMELDRHVQHHGGGWRLRFEAAETKGDEPIECAWPPELVENLEAYLAVHRSQLLRTSRAPEAIRALWASKRGGPMGPDAIEVQVKERTHEAFGEPINPHVFRHIAATWIATNKPDGASDIRSVLSHSSIATSEKYYNRATMLGASTAYQQTLVHLRGKQRA